jgi:hypothetical protein
MTVRLGIALLVIGAILTFALTIVVPGVALQTVGWIFMLAGVLVMVLSYVRDNQARRSARISRTQHADGTETVTERRSETRGGPVV